MIQQMKDKEGRKEGRKEEKFLKSSFLLHFIPFSFQLCL